MINRIAEFEKVSLEQFRKDVIQLFSFSPEEIEKMYEEIKLPERATDGSSGYDICTPITFSLSPQETIKIPTGIRVNIEEGWEFSISPRSGLGTKYRIQLDNTIGKIDSDYYFSDNEGHIMIQITNDSKINQTTNDEQINKILRLESGNRFVQGTFYIYGITRSDNATAKRNGGFNSTGTK